MGRTGTPLESDLSASEFRQLASRSKDARQARRLLSLAAIRDGMSREDAARVGGMDRQTLRDWVIRFNQEGPDGLLDRKRGGNQPRLSPEQMKALEQIVENGPNLETDGVVRWRARDLQRVIEDRLDVCYGERHVMKLLNKLGFSHMSTRPRNPRQDVRIMEAFKKTSTRP